MAEDDWATKVAPYLDESDGAVGLQDNQLPFLRWFPWSRSQSPGSAAILTYLKQMTAALQGARLGQEVLRLHPGRDHQALGGAAGGALRPPRCTRPTTPPARGSSSCSPTTRGRTRSAATKTANTFLYDDVDIWTLRYYYFFGRIPAVRERQNAGKEIWWYSYTNDSVRRTPSFVIDKPHIDSRVWGWMMEEWNVDGLLNWGFNRWGKATTGDGWRDPYRDPLSLIKGHLRSNGDTCLVYPGYYPRYGLDRPTAGPVSSLRLEALRDGLEEREYLSIAKTLPGRRAPWRTTSLGTITQVPLQDPSRPTSSTSPTYTHSNATFDAARERAGRVHRGAAAVTQLTPGRGDGAGRRT